MSSFTVELRRISYSKHELWAKSRASAIALAIDQAADEFRYDEIEVTEVFCETEAEY